MVDLTARERLVKLEEDASRRFKERAHLDRLGHLSDEALKDLLVQRRYIAERFSFFCDVISAPMRNREGIAIMQSIILDEYQPTNHRVEFVEELEQLGRDRDTIFRTPINPITRKAARTLIDVAERAQPYDDATRLCLMRFCGELLPGAEYKVLYNELNRRQLIQEQGSRFLWPHIQYDLVGHDKGKSHAERFLGLLDILLARRTDWRPIAKFLNASAIARASFYDQIDSRHPAL